MTGGDGPPRRSPRAGSVLGGERKEWGMFLLSSPRIRVLKGQHRLLHLEA